MGGTGGYFIEKRALGSSGVDITALGYGAMELRVPANHKYAGVLLNAALDSGIGFIDTSPDYGDCERLIGEYIAGRRNEYILATKCACNLSGEGPGHIFTRAQFEKNLTTSLKNLKTDYVDLWQIHCPTPADLPGARENDAVSYMLDMKREGLVRAIGISFKNGSASDPAYPTEHQRLYAREMAGWGVFDAVQLVYGAFTRLSEGDIGHISLRGTGIIARGALQRYFAYYDRLPALARLDELFDEGDDLSAFLLRFAMSQGGISSVIVGSANAGHIRANAKAASKGPLTAQILEEAIRRITCAHSALKV